MERTVKVMASGGAKKRTNTSPAQGRCVIPIKRRTVQTSNSCVIRVNAETLQEIVDICDCTGRSIVDVATRLLEYALERVEIKGQ